MCRAVLPMLLTIVSMFRMTILAGHGREQPRRSNGESRASGVSVSESGVPSGLVNLDGISIRGGCGMGDVVSGFLGLLRIPR